MIIKRLLDCNASDFRRMGKKEILESIRASEGRVMVCEVIGAVQPLLDNVSNAELAAAFGADLVLLNMLDLNTPIFYGLPLDNPEMLIAELKALTGRIIGGNLEAVDEETTTLVPGRRATVVTVRKAREMGADFIVLTGNPGTGVSNARITEAVREFHEKFGAELIIAAGKMHAAGVSAESGEEIITESEVNELIAAGCDLLLLPAPGTVPGITMEYVRNLVRLAHTQGVLTMTAIGTSQEGADEATIREIALLSKMTGTDLHHIGDAGYPGIAVPENIIAYSMAIRGRRHTYSRMARSVNR